ncbi:MAG TPA: GNAT family N-acetyltransferase, partial [Solirubrobacterales bacterium]
MATTGYEREAELEDGTRVHLRPLTAADEPLLHDALARMSERSVYFRFLSPLKRLPQDLAHNLAAVDGEARFALCATTHRLGGELPERILGVARYDRVPGSDVAEVAVAVVDDFQRRGLGSTLLSMLAGIARDHGIRTFTLIVLPENQSMLKLLRRLGWIHQARLNGGLYEISFHLGEL